MIVQCGPRKSSPPSVCICIWLLYRGADKSLARPTSRCILFDGENISFDASFVIYMNSTNIPPIMIINRVYENLPSLELVSFLVGLRTYRHPRIYFCIYAMLRTRATFSWPILYILMSVDTGFEYFN